MDKPILFVDIDGTLNPRSTKSGLTYEEMVVDGVTVRFCIDHGSWLDSLTDLYELVWCSAWGEKSSLISDVLGLPEFPYVPVWSMDSGRMNDPSLFTPKIREVQEYVGDRPFVWIDDCLNEDAHQWVDKRNETVPTLLVEVDPEIGLRREDIQLIQDFYDYAFGEADV